ncbi:unnamed protein product [Trichogramma brassicae]|uniref:DUF7041 domain-containing protein n=1 Tax=Trichogramma brassicae TaxID=86971 RepID=A0A6H5ISQ9_9HYME|nr:unnamed protein product [Trichogramma brassicae]
MSPILTRFWYVIVHNEKVPKPKFWTPSPLLPPTSVKQNSDIYVHQNCSLRDVNTATTLNFDNLLERCDACRSSNVYFQNTRIDPRSTHPSIIKTISGCSATAQQSPRSNIRQRPLSGASPAQTLKPARVFFMPFFFPLSCPPRSWTLVDDEQPLIWHAVQRQSRSGREKARLCAELRHLTKNTTRWRGATQKSCLQEERSSSELHISLLCVCVEFTPGVAPASRRNSVTRYTSGAADAAAAVYTEQQQRGDAADAATAAAGPPRYVNRVAVKLPAFRMDKPAIWFAQVEAQFALADVTVELTKYYHVISQLDVRAASEVEDIISNPPGRQPYTNLRQRLIERLSTSEEHRVRRILHDEELGDRKPTSS